MTAAGYINRTEVNEVTERITDLLGKKIILCDGAMGTMLQSYGLKAEGPPELISFTRPDVVKEIYGQYYRAGSDFVSANTFGVNRFKLADSGYTVSQVVARAVSLAREAATEFRARADQPASAQGFGKKFVALDLGPSGRLMEPSGDLSFDEAYDVFKEMVVAGAEAGADFILFETFIDIYEMKAAVLAAKENCDLPVFCSVTFQKNGRMLMGTDPLSAVNILQDLGVDALGVNCSLGPADMIGIVKEILAYSKLPVMAQPNAGLPELIDGKAVYHVDVAEYVGAMQEMLRAGVAIAGGCCGTTPDYIAALAGSIQSKDYPALLPDVEAGRKTKTMTAVSSSAKTVTIGGGIRIIGENINPAGRKQMQEALKERDYTYIRKEAMSQVRAGADILNVSVGLPDLDEREMMIQVMNKISNGRVPLQIDSADPAVIEAAARYYNGKPLISSVNGRKDSMEAVFPIVKKYGACVVALTLDERGLPKTAEERVEIAGRIIQTAESCGIGRERILVDCLAVSGSAHQGADPDALEAIRRIKKQYGVKTVLKADRTSLAMALSAGADALVIDPLVPEFMDIIREHEDGNISGDADI